MGFWESLQEKLAPAAGALVVGCLALTLILIGVLIFFIVRYNALKKRLERFMSGFDGTSLEDRLLKVIDDNQRVKIQLRNNVNSIVKLNDEMRSAYRKIGVVKYNAFPGMAGKMSSSVCLLNNENNGFIINSIHGQDGCYTYVKEIMNGKSVTALTKEDEEALEKAIES